MLWCPLPSNHFPNDTGTCAWWSHRGFGFGGKDHGFVWWEGNRVGRRNHQAENVIHDSTQHELLQALSETSQVYITFLCLSLPSLVPRQYITYILNFVAPSRANFRVVLIPFTTTPHNQQLIGADHDAADQKVANAQLNAGRSAVEMIKMGPDWEMHTTMSSQMWLPEYGKWCQRQRQGMHVYLP